MLNYIASKLYGTMIGAIMLGEGEMMEAVDRGCEATAMPVPPSANLPETLYRAHVLACDQPDKDFTFDFMSDYLTMMDVLAKSVAHELDRACGITPLQYRAMVRLLDVDEAAAGSLAHDLGVGASTVSTAVSKLACRGLLVRSESLSDMRAVHLALSDAGRTVVERADAAAFAIMQEYWGSLTSEQFEAASRSSLSAVERHSHPRIEGGMLRLDTALVDTVMISRMLTARALQAHGLATSDFRVMLALRVMGGSDTSATIARFLFLNSSDITSCLKNLEARSFITRSRSDANRRVRSVALTEAGQRELTRLMPVVFDALHETCHSDDELIRTHISAARDLVARRRQRSDF